MNIKQLMALVFCMMCVLSSFAQGAFEYDKGIQEYNSGNLEEAASWFKKSGNAGNAEGWYMYAETKMAIFHNSLGVRNDAKEDAVHSYYLAQRHGCKNIKHARDVYANWILEMHSYGYRRLGASAKRECKKALLWLNFGKWKL